VSDLVAAELVAASPSPAAHIALVGIVVVAALVIFGIVRSRNKRDAAQAEMHATTDDNPRGASRSADEENR
jgi:hypothetical protein